MDIHKGPYGLCIDFHKALTATTYQKLLKTVQTKKVQLISFYQRHENDLWQQLNDEIFAQYPNIDLCLSSWYDGAWADLEFLAYLPNIEYFTLSEWLVTDISPIAQLTKLKRLRILTEFKSKKVSLRPLANLSQLETLVLPHMKDLDTIAAFKSLNKLSLDKIKTENLEFLTQNQNLEDVFFWGCNGIKNFDALSTLPKLKELTLKVDTRLERIDFINELHQLEILELIAISKITKLPSFSNLAKLKEIYITDCLRLKDISTLLEVKNLEKAYITGKELLPQDFAVLAQHPTLQKVGSYFSKKALAKEFTNMDKRFTDTYFSPNLP